MARNTGSLSSASMIDLKAELFRKQEEYKKKKAEIQSTSEGYIRGKVEDGGIKKKTNIWSKKNKGVLERAQRDFEIKAEEENVNEKSRKALEAKARLYDKITNSSEIPEEDGSGTYLVDFQRKVIDSIDEKIENDRDKERSLQDNEVPPPSTPDEEWVDYVDSLGRSRRCFRKDLPALIEQDKKFSKQSGAQNVEVKGSSDNLPTLLSNDMKREIERQKWEEEELEKIKDGPIHYANVQHNEIRTHGVGFYQFSKNDEERQEQMETLTNIRDQTVTARSKMEKLKEKRKAQLEARLEKVKQRRKMKEGYVETEVESKENEVKKDDEIGPKIDEMLTQQRAMVDDETKKDKPLREWDKGKERMFDLSEDKYFQDRRDERDPDFAPPSIYKDAPKQMGKKSKMKKNQRKSAEKVVDNQSQCDTSTGEKKTANQIIEGMLSEQRSLASQTPQNTEGDVNITDPEYNPNVPYCGESRAEGNYQQQWGTYPYSAGFEVGHDKEHGLEHLRMGQSKSSGLNTNIPSVTQSSTSMNFNPTTHTGLPNFCVPPPGYNPNNPLPGSNHLNTQQSSYPLPSYYPHNYAPQDYGGNAHQDYAPQCNQNYAPQQDYAPQPNQNHVPQPPQKTNRDYSQYFSGQGQSLFCQSNVGTAASKLDIVDTRLVKKDDGLDDFEESKNVQAISSKAVPYKPGTFYLASLKKEREATSLDSQVSEAASVSKHQTLDSEPMSLSGGAVIYKSENE